MLACIASKTWSPMRGPNSVWLSLMCVSLSSPRQTSPACARHCRAPAGPCSGTGGLAPRPHRSPTGRATGHRGRLLRSLGSDLRQGLLERGHSRLRVLVAGCRRVLRDPLDQRIRRTVLDEFRIELGVGVLVELVEIVVVQDALLEHAA